jgi:hypothetical protein
VRTGATLIAIPDTLREHWVTEVAKCVPPGVVFVHEYLGTTAHRKAAVAAMQRVTTLLGRMASTRRAMAEGRDDAHDGDEPEDGGEGEGGGQGGRKKGRGLSRKSTVPQLTRLRNMGQQVIEQMRVARAEIRRLRASTFAGEEAVVLATYNRLG